MRLRPLVRLPVPRAAPIAITVAILLAASAPARSDDPVTSDVRFTREIVRIFDRKCLSCHMPGGIAMSLATYRDVRPWARAIREELVEQRMPPWSAARGYSRFVGDIGLTPRELATILTWVDGGIPKGDDSDLPPRPPASAPDAAAAPADHRVEIPPQQIPGEGEDVVRRVIVDSGLTADRWVRQLQVRPGDRRLLRAAFVSVLPSGSSRSTSPAARGAAARDPATREPATRKPTAREQAAKAQSAIRSAGTQSAATWAGAWTPWQTFVTPPEPAAFLIRAGSRLLVELHYRGQEAAATDRGAIDFDFAPEGSSLREMTSMAIETRQAVKATGPSRARGETVLARDAVVWALRADLPADGPSLDGHSLEVTARKPDGSIEVLLWIPTYRSEWPAPFVLHQPARLPAGTVISATATGTPPPLHARAILTVYH